MDKDAKKRIHTLEESIKEKEEVYAKQQNMWQDKINIAKEMKQMTVEQNNEYIQKQQQ